MKADGANKPKLDASAIRAIGQAITEARQPSDTIIGLIGQWRSSPEWKKLAASTRSTWGFALDVIEARWGVLPLAIWSDPRMVAKIVDWRDSRAATPRAADVGVTVLLRLLEFGRLRAKVKVNVAAGIPAIYSGADRAEIIWTEDDIEAFTVAALQLGRPHVIDGLWLAGLTGMRRADLVGLKLEEAKGKAIIRTARKKSRGRRRRAVIPMIPETEQLLDELRSRFRAPDVDTVLVNSLGRPWTPASFTQAFNQVRDHARIIHPGDVELGIEDRAKHLHDCRGTFVTKLCRAGLTDREIADIVAWAPENVGRIRMVYVDDAATVVALSERIRRVL